MRFRKFVEIAVVLAVTPSSCKTTNSRHTNFPDTDRSSTYIQEPIELAHQRVVRSIAMYYKIDLKQDNAHSPAFAGILQENDQSLRSCYVDRLDTVPNLKGNLVFDFELAPRIPSISHVSRIGGNIKDLPLERCLRERTIALPFHAPRKMRGTVTYSFEANLTTIDEKNIVH